MAFNHQTIEEAFSATCRQESEMDQYQEEKKALMRRPTLTYQWKDVKKKKSFVSSSEIAAPPVRGSGGAAGDKT